MIQGSPNSPPSSMTRGGASKSPQWTTRRPRTMREIRSRTACGHTIGGLDRPGTDDNCRRTRLAMRRLAMTSRFAQIGELACGIVHELSNPISCLRANFSLLPAYVESLECLAAQAPDCGDRAITMAAKIHEVLAEMSAAVNLVASISSSVRSLANSGMDLPLQIDLHECIEAALRIASHELKGHVLIEKDLGNIPTVMAHGGLLTQVLLNLFANAAHAINDQGTLKVRTRLDGADVLVEVTDTGCGIAPEHIRKLFEPFFTTKPFGQGLGLGLAISKNIVDRHGGRIEVTSELGSGTTARVWLPSVPITSPIYQGTHIGES